MRVHLYGRVSTDHQDNSAKSQRLRLEDYARQQGWDVVDAFVDEDVSGGTQLRARPEGQRMWSLLQSGDVILACRQDRLFRSVIDAASTLADLQQIGVVLRTIEGGGGVDNVQAELMFSVMAAFAQYERQLIGQRVREAWAYRRQSGRPYANARPYGWKRSGDQYVPLNSERAIGLDCLDLRRSGASHAQISMWLMRRGVKKPVSVRTNAGHYHPAEVQRLISAAAAGYPRLLPDGGLPAVPARRLRGPERRALLLERAAASPTQTDQSQTPDQPQAESQSHA